MKGKISRLKIHQQCIDQNISTIANIQYLSMKQILKGCLGYHT